MPRERTGPRKTTHGIGVCVLNGWLALMLTACDPPTSPEGKPRLAVSNSYLEAAVADLTDGDVSVVRLAEPGACPGHFDLRPSQLRALRACSLLLRFDFQGSLDRQVSSGAARPQIVPIRVADGMCVPASYAGACRDVAEALVDAGLLDDAAARRRLADVEQRLAARLAWAREQVRSAGLDGAPVVASHHQAAFCEVIGLHVVARFRGADVASIDEIDQAIQRGLHARVVIANLPEGRGLADAIGRRLRAPVVVFGNFPDHDRHGLRFDELVRDNVEQLVRAVRP